jgi:hypothetical protein
MGDTGFALGPHRALRDRALRPGSSHSNLSIASKRWRAHERRSPHQWLMGAERWWAILF